MKRTTLLVLTGACAFAMPAFGKTLQVLYGDQTTDQVVFAADLNGDGDADDIGETQVFFDENNASGLTSPTGSVFVMTQDTSGAVYYGDGRTDSVYRLKDRNGNNTAQDAGEASVWFSSSNADGRSLNTPNGIATDSKGAVYIVEADTRGNPSGDYVYKTVDLNGDGDANDAGESSVWLDLTALSATSSPFEIHFDGDVAYIADSNFGDPRIYRAQDTNGDGSITSEEVMAYVSGTNAPFVFGFDVENGDIFAADILNDGVVLLSDTDNSGVIDQAGEQVLVWDGLAAGGGAFFTADVQNGEVLVASNGSSLSPEEDALFRLLDLNGDGDYLDAGESTKFLSFVENGTYPVRARTAMYYTSPVPLPASAPLLLVGAGALVLMRRKPRTNQIQ